MRSEVQTNIAPIAFERSKTVHRAGVAVRPTLLFVAAFALNASPHEATHALTAYLLGFNSTLYQMWVNPEAAGATPRQLIAIAVAGPTHPVCSLTRADLVMTAAAFLMVELRVTDGHDPLSRCNGFSRQGSDLVGQLSELVNRLHLNWEMLERSSEFKLGSCPSVTPMLKSMHHEKLLDIFAQSSRSQ
jgi:hypothetical protein